MTRIKAEIGTTGEFEEIDISGDANADLLTAVLLEHGCTNRSCDVREAAENGFGYTAAWLLFGATECPLVCAVADHYGIDASKVPQDFEAWKAHFDSYGVRCIYCDACTFGDDYRQPPIACANCGAGLVDFPIERLSDDLYTGRIRYQWADRRHQRDRQT